MSLPRAVALVPAALGLLLFTACAGGAVAEEAASSKAPEPTTEAVAEQTVAEACLLLQSGAMELVALGQQEDAFTAAMADPAGQAAKFESADAAFAAAVDQVSNAEVLVPAEVTSEAMHGLAAFLRGAIDDPAGADPNEVGPFLEDLYAGLGGIREVCS
ncbi:hypothetical protein [Agromyces mariniharenae]|uniref:Uncharacterized protein n=1 Tax=Agromyces mariniharenae TaxID=2604423 RepID=A0A5S4V279_9MICO|nr:hypothetical protein [Agromyces mariniharenae]TYL53046.1 hypothetical protein FYC51_04840 [Agromyces mariniharenae]